MSQPAEAEIFERDPVSIVDALVRRGRMAMEDFASSDQARVDEAVTALAWSLYKPAHAEALAAMAVEDTGLGNAVDKVVKNQRKTFGTLRDLMRVKSVGVIEECPERGLVKYAKPVGVVGAVTPSTNPAATPVNKAMMALKGRNAIVIAPSPAGTRDDHTRGDADAGGTRKDRRAGGPGAGSARPGGQGDHQRADGGVRPGRGHRLAEQRACRLPQRHARDRCRRRQRPGHRRFQREA